MKDTLKKLFADSLLWKKVGRMQTFPVIEKGIGELNDNYLLIISSMGLFSNLLIFYI